MPQRSVATNYTFEQQRTEINSLAADFWSHKTTVDGASSTYLKHDGSNDFTGNTLNVPNAFTINSNSGAGTLTISGNLTVTGTTTTVNTATLDVTDKNITIAKGNSQDATADGAGITIDSGTDITWNFVNANSAWVSSIGVEATTFLKGPYGQFTGSGVPTTGQGVQINAPDANTGQIASYDHTNTAYKQLNLKGSSVGIYTGTSNVLEASFNSTGLTVEGNLINKGSGVFGTSDATIAGNGKLVCHIDTDKNVAFNGAQSEVGNVPALVAFQDSGTLTDIGFRGTTVRFANSSAEVLRIGSDSNITQTIDTDGDGFIIAAGNIKPMLTGNSNRSAENNTIFGVRGQWNNTEVGRIAFEAGASTTNKDDGNINLYTKSAGGSLTSRLRITSTGQLIHNTDNASGHIAEFNQTNTNNDARININSPTDNNIRPAFIQLSQAGTAKWGIGQVYASTSDKAFHILAGNNDEANSKLVVTTAGNVGIGNVNPTTKLSVDGGTTNNATVVQIKNDSTSAYATTDGGLNTALSLYSDGTDSAQSVGIQFYCQKSGDTGCISEIGATRESNGNSTLVFRTRDSATGVNERLRITSGGDIKIPGGGYLDFYGSRSTYRHTGSYGEFKNPTGDLYCSVGNDYKFGNGDFSIEYLTIKKDTGYVGIGIDTPAKTGIQNNVSVLQIDSGDGAELILGNSVSANVQYNHVGAIAFKNIDNSQNVAPNYCGIRSNCVDQSGNMNLKFYGGSTDFEADTPHMVIDATGKISIGTTNNHDRDLVVNTGGSSSVYFGMTGTNANMPWVSSTKPLLSVGTDGTGWPSDASTHSHKLVNFGIGGGAAGTSATVEHSHFAIQLNGTILSQHGVQSGGNSTGGYKFNSQYSGKGYDIATQYATSANGGSGGGDPMFSGWWGSDNTLRINTNGVIKAKGGIETWQSGIYLPPSQTLKVNSVTSSGGAFQGGFVSKNVAYEEYAFKWYGNTAGAVNQILIKGPSYFEMDVEYHCNQSNSSSGGVSIHRVTKGQFANNYVTHTWNMHYQEGSCWTIATGGATFGATDWNGAANGTGNANGLLSIIENNNGGGSYEGSTLVLKIYYCSGNIQILHSKT